MSIRLVDSEVILKRKFVVKVVLSEFVLLFGLRVEFFDFELMENLKILCRIDYVVGDELKVE